MIFEHDVTRIKLTELVFDQNNPNRMSIEQMASLRKAMERFGYLNPIIVDQHNKIADGEHRALIYKEFGLTEIPAYRVTFSDDSERVLLRQTMNKLRGEHDPALDAEEMARLYEAHKLPDLSALIAEQEQTIKKLILRYKPGSFGHEDDKQIDEIIDEQLKKTVPDTNLGDIIQLGSHKLICADCTDKRSLYKLLENNAANLILTDPPYDAEHLPIYQELAKLAYQTLAPGGSIVTYVRQYDIPQIFKYMKNAGLTYHWVLLVELAGPFSRAFDRGIVIKQKPLLWYTKGKRKPNENNEYISDLIQSSTTTQDKKLHEWAQNTTESLQIIQRLTSKGQIVFDPMLGSGTTLIACEQTGRQCYGVEIDPHYCDVIIKRYENYTNNKAVRL